METNTQKCVVKLFGLLFLPLEDVNETFECIVENAEENLDDHRLHWENVCSQKAWRRQKSKNSKIFGRNLECSYISTEPRGKQCIGRLTNLISEAAGSISSFIWRFIEVLNCEQQSSEQFITQVLGVHTQIRPPTSRQYTRNQIDITEKQTNAKPVIRYLLKSSCSSFKSNLAELYDEEEQEWM